MKIDETDERIINILSSNGQTQRREISKMLHLSEGTIRKRIKRLIDSNVLRIKGLVNSNSRSDKQLVYLMIKLVGNRDSINIAKLVSELPHILSVSIVSGRFDLLAEVYVEPHSLIDFLNKEFASIDSILTFESFICLRSFNKWV
jgi:Lrp/AsnC family transcriptional regulator for asnA, asnC and gidA